VRRIGQTCLRILFLSSGGGGRWAEGQDYTSWKWEEGGSVYEGFNAKQGIGAEGGGACLRGAKGKPSNMTGVFAATRIQHNACPGR
jgi:hypothetical protein